MYPKISVITPSFNQGKYLESTIKSVLEQEYPNLEYIIIDGGSADNSVGIIKKYEKYLAYWESVKDMGQSHAINKGFAVATGEILAWLNSDDTYEQNALFIIAEWFQKNPELDFIYGDVNMIDEKGVVFHKKRELDFDFLMGCCIGFGLIIGQQSAFWRRSIYDKIGGTLEDLYYNMDGEYFARIAHEGFKIKHIPLALSNFRWHDEGKTTIHNKIKKDKKNQLEAAAELIQSYKYLPFSKFIPYRFSKPFHQIFRLKRILKKIYLGYYK